MERSGGRAGGVHEAITQAAYAGLRAHVVYEGLRTQAAYAGQITRVMYTKLSAQSAYTRPFLGLAINNRNHCNKQP